MSGKYQIWSNTAKDDDDDDNMYKVSGQQLQQLQNMPY
jgi:hypothetical protein